MLHSVKTGETAFDHVYGEAVFEYLSHNLEAAEIFNSAMTGLSGLQMAGIVDAYDFSGTARVVDVGGGHGSLISAILKANPEMQGVLFAQPHVVEGAESVLDAAGVRDRCELVGGDFFESVPPEGDAYVMKWIIHDWDDDLSITILKSCRRAIRENGKLLLVERIIPPGNDESPATLGDMIMMVVPGGQERTEQEYRALLSAAGFQLTRIIPTQSEMDIIEGEPI